MFGLCFFYRRFDKKKLQMPPLPLVPVVAAAAKGLAALLGKHATATALSAAKAAATHAYGVPRLYRDVIRSTRAVVPTATEQRLVQAAVKGVLRAPNTLERLVEDAAVVRWMCGHLELADKNAVRARAALRVR